MVRRALETRHRTAAERFGPRPAFLRPAVHYAGLGGVTAWLPATAPVALLSVLMILVGWPVAVIAAGDGLPAGNSRSSSGGRGFASGVFNTQPDRSAP